MSETTSLPLPEISALIIGDEILSGRRHDKHLSRLIMMLKARGMQLDWAHYCGDRHEALAQALRQSFASGAIVFSFGGIGATPDDNTRQAAATALGLPLKLHPEAEALIRQRFGDQITPHRLEMGVFPEGSTIIPNPFNQIPGFSIQQHHFVPGFPIMSWPMVEWVLDTLYPHLHHQQDYIEQSVIVWEVHEGGLVGLMEEIEQQYGVTIFSLPAVEEENGRRSVELGAKGTHRAVSAAMQEICDTLDQRHLNWQVQPSL